MFAFFKKTKVSALLLGLMLLAQPLLQALVPDAPKWEYAAGFAVAEEQAEEAPELTPEPTPEPTPIPTAVPTAAPTATPTAEPTAAPTAAPTAEPTPELTAEPVAMEEATAEPTAELPIAAEQPTEPTAMPAATAEPTATSTPEPEAETVEPEDPFIDTTRDASFSPAFTQGWATLLNPGNFYLRENDPQPMGRLIGSDEIVFAIGRVHAGEAGDVVSIALNLAGDLCEGFVNAKLLRPLAADEVEAYLQSAGRSTQRILYASDESRPLLPMTFAPAAPDTEGIEETEKEPQKVEEPRPTLSLSSKAAQVITCTTLDQFQSDHPYAPNTDTVWTASFGNASSVSVTFSSETLVEAGYGSSFFDALFVGGSATDGTFYTGNQLSSFQVSIPGNTVYIRLVSDSINEYYGFSVNEIEPVGIAPQKPTTFYTTVDESLNVKLTWSAASGANQYQIYRSPFGTDTYELLATTSALKYTDTAAKSQTDKKFSYKIVPQFVFDTLTYDGIESIAHCVLATSGLKIAKLTASGTDKIVLNWTALPGVSRYQIYRGTTSAGSFTPLTTVSGTATKYTNAVTRGKKYYYRIAPIYVESGVQLIGRISPVLSGQRGLQKPAKPTVSPRAATQTTVKWTKVAYATSYIIYRSTSPSGKYQKIGTSKTASFIDKKAKAGTRYAYKIKATGKVLGKAETSSASVYGLGLTTGKPTLTVKQLDAETVQLKWTKAAGASGYYIYRKAPGAASYSKIKEVSSKVFTYKAKLPQDQKYYYLIKPVKKVSKTIYSGVNSAGKSIQLKDKTTYRALLVGNVNYKSSSDLPSCKYDVAGMKKALSSLTGTKYTTITTKTDQTAAQMKAAIRSTFKNATKTDVSLFYFSGHGVTSGGANGSLVGNDESLFLPWELRSVLDEIPGKKIVLVASCGSGSLISPYSFSTSGSFESGLISAFVNNGASDKAFFVDDDDEGDYAAKSNELQGSDYFVMTSAKNGEFSWCSLYFDIFTRHLCQALGYDYYTGQSTGFPADKDKNKQLTIKEMYSYIAPKVGSSSLYGQATSSVRAYPSSTSTKVLFKK